MLVKLMELGKIKEELTDKRMVELSNYEIIRNQAKVYEVSLT